MSELRVVAERAIGAPATLVYRLIADFDRHPSALPAAGVLGVPGRGGWGRGVGTVHSFRMTAGRRTRSFRMRVEEPDPGRVLTESEMGSSMVTTWVVTPEGPGCRVRLETRWQGAGGVGGLFERLFAPRTLRRLYTDELERLDRYARTAPPG